MSARKKPKPVIFMFSTNKKNWNDSTESIQKQKISKLTKSDTSVKIKEVNSFLLESRAAKSGFGRILIEKKKFDEDKLSEGPILHISPKNSNSGELALLRITLSRPQSQIFHDDALADKKIQHPPEIELDIFQIIEGSETAPKDRVPWKYLRRATIYEKQKKKSILRWLRSIHFHYNKTLHRKQIVLSCPNCTFAVTTTVKHVNSVRTLRNAISLTPFGLCGLPYLMFLFKDVVHLCPLCNFYLGFCPAFKYHKSSEVVADIVTHIRSIYQANKKEGAKDVKNRLLSLFRCKEDNRDKDFQ